MYFQNPQCYQEVVEEHLLLLLQLLTIQVQGVWHLQEGQCLLRGEAEAGQLRDQGKVWSGGYGLRVQLLQQHLVIMTMWTM